MGKEKCHLEGMYWYSDLPKNADTSRSDCLAHVHPCYMCGKSVCAYHRTKHGICDKCTTLYNKWTDWRKDKYTKIYMSTTKACRQ